MTRYREDPVRMLRAVRLAAKLGVAIDPKTAAPIPKLAPLMQNVPPARLFDEMQKLLLSGHAVETLKSLRAHGLSHGLLPLLDVILEQPLGQRFIELALADTDERVRDDRGVSPGFLFATLLWHEVLATWNAAKARGERPIPALFEAMDAVLERQAKKLAIPRRFEATIKEIWSLQPRFEQRAGQRPFRLLEHPRFRAGWDFLELRGESGELEGELAELADWWDRFANAAPRRARGDAEARRGARRSAARSRGRGRKRARATASAAPPTPTPDAGAGVSAVDAYRRAGQQSRPSAPAARARASRAIARLPRVARRRRLAELRERAGRRRRAAARLRQRGRRACARRSRRARCSPRCSAIERRQHRRREREAQRNAPRTLDLDLLLYGRRRIRRAGLDRAASAHARARVRAAAARRHRAGGDDSRARARAALSAAPCAASASRAPARHVL